jgi:hypothetical protein
MPLIILSLRKNLFNVEILHANISLQALTALSKPQNSAIWALNSRVLGTPAAQLTVQSCQYVATALLKQEKNAILRIRTEYRAQAVMHTFANAASGIASLRLFAEMVLLRVAKR